MSECVRWPFAYLQLLTTTSSTKGYDVVLVNSSSATIMSDQHGPNDMELPKQVKDQRFDLLRPPIDTITKMAGCISFNVVRDRCYDCTFFFFFFLTKFHPIAIVPDDIIHYESPCPCTLLAPILHLRNKNHIGFIICHVSL